LEGKESYQIYCQKPTLSKAVSSLPILQDVLLFVAPQEEIQFLFQAAILPGPAFGTHGLEPLRGAGGHMSRSTVRAENCAGGSEPLTAPSLHWRCTNKQQINDEYLFASKLANVLAQPATSNRYIRIFYLLIANK